MLIASTATLVVGACSLDLPTPVLVEVTGSISGADALAVTDTAVVTATFVDAQGNTVTGLQVQWHSDDDGIVTVAALAKSTESSRDSARLTAHGTGSTRVLATVTEPGFESYSAAVTVTVSRWAVRASSPWPDTLTVADLDTLELEIPNSDSLLASALRVVWLSTNDSVISVRPAIPPDTANRAQILAAKRRAVVTAHGSGRARVFATVSREGFEQSEFSDSIAVDPLTIVPVGSWIDTTFVSDIDTFEVSVRGHGGQLKPAGGLQWVSSDPTLLAIRPLSSVRVEVTAKARGNAQLTAVIDEPGFEPVQVVHPIRFLERWKSVSAGASHTCGVTIGGAAFCWGVGQHGALGNGKTSNSLTPSAVAGGITGFVAVSAGEGFTCATVVTIYCWGWGAKGALGNGDLRESDRLTPVEVSGGLELQQVSSGGNSEGGATCAIATDGRAWCWGDNVRWQLGLDLREANVSQELCPDSLHPCSRVPIRVGIGGALPDQYAMLGVGGSHSCGLAATDLIVYCWGKHNRALGDSAVDSTRIPRAVLGLATARAVTAGDQHACAITVTSAGFCWGIGTSGELGNSAANSSDVPVPVAGLHQFNTVSAGDLHTCALTIDGTAYCWGRGNQGQLGNSLTVQMNLPDSVVTPYKFESISAGAFHTCGVLSGAGAVGVRKKIVTGAILCWGQGSGGRLGNNNGNAMPTPIPTRVLEPPPGS